MHKYPRLEIPNSWIQSAVIPCYRWLVKVVSRQGDSNALDTNYLGDSMRDCGVKYGPKSNRLGFSSILNPHGCRWMQLALPNLVVERAKRLGYAAQAHLIKLQSYSVRECGRFI